jgi:hypothetical protein
MAWLTTQTPFLWLPLTLNGTLSFSTEFIARMTSSSSKSRLAIPSKHFFRWGWTRVGSYEATTEGTVVAYQCSSYEIFTSQGHISLVTGFVTGLCHQ